MPGRFDAVEAAGAELVPRIVIPANAGIHAVVEAVWSAA